jgi:hypothetical protein
VECNKVFRLSKRGVLTNRLTNTLSSALCLEKPRRTGRLTVGSNMTSTEVQERAEEERKCDATGEARRKETTRKTKT